MSSRSRWPVLSGLVLVILAFSAFWYGHNQASGPRAPAHGGRYVEAVVGVPSIVNPLYATFNDVDKDLAAPAGRFWSCGCPRLWSRV